MGSTAEAAGAARRSEQARHAALVRSSRTDGAKISAPAQAGYRRLLERDVVDPKRVMTERQIQQAIAAIDPTDFERRVKAAGAARTAKARAAKALKAQRRAAAADRSDTVRHGSGRANKHVQ